MSLNSFPPIDFNQSFSSIKTYIYNYLWKHFEANFNQFNPFSFHYLYDNNDLKQDNINVLTVLLEHGDLFNLSGNIKHNIPSYCYISF